MGYSLTAFAGDKEAGIAGVAGRLRRGGTEWGHPWPRFMDRGPSLDPEEWSRLCFIRGGLQHLKIQQVFLPAGCFFVLDQFSDTNYGNLHVTNAQILV